MHLGCSTKWLNRNRFWVGARTCAAALPVQTSRSVLLSSPAAGWIGVNRWIWNWNLNQLEVGVSQFGDGNAGMVQNRTDATAMGLVAEKFRDGQWGKVNTHPQSKRLKKISGINSPKTLHSSETSNGEPDNAKDLIWCQRMQNQRTHWKTFTSCTKEDRQKNSGDKLLQFSFQTSSSTSQQQHQLTRREQTATTRRTTNPRQQLDRYHYSAGRRRRELAGSSA